MEPAKYQAGNAVATVNPKRPEAAYNANRIAQCVNACAGIADPEAAIQAAREVLTDLAAMPVARAYPDGPCLYREDMEAVKAALAQLSPKESTR
jgi:hypothetical protein